MQSTMEQLHPQPQRGIEVDEMTLQQHNIVDRILINFGVRRLATQVQRSGWRAPSEFYWFKCSRCHKITANYIHGFFDYLPCNHCEHERLMQIAAMRNNIKSSSKAPILTVVMPKTA